MQRGDTRCFRRLEHAGVPASKRGSEFPGRHQKWEIPGDYLPRDSQRSRFPSWKCVIQFIRPAGVVKEMRRNQRQIDVARFLDRLAAVHRFEHSQLARFFLENARNAEEVFAAFAAGKLAPAFESAGGG